MYSRVNVATLIEIAYSRQSLDVAQYCAWSRMVPLLVNYLQGARISVEESVTLVAQMLGDTVDLANPENASAYLSFCAAIKSPVEERSSSHASEEVQMVVGWFKFVMDMRLRHRIRWAGFELLARQYGHIDIDSIHVAPLPHGLIVYRRCPSINRLTRLISVGDFLAVEAKTGHQQRLTVSLEIEDALRALIESWRFGHEPARTHLISIATGMLNEQARMRNHS